MDDQASVKGGARDRANGSNGVVGSIAEFGNDVATLAELQAKLAAADFQECRERTFWILCCAGLGIALALACLPVALLGVAALIASRLAIHPGLAMVLTAGVTLVVATLVVVVAGRRLVRGFDSFQRSREELVRNLTWIRSVIARGGKPGGRSL